MGEEILSEYSKTLPENLRDSMPSLGECYDKLSVKLHAADPDETVSKKLWRRSKNIVRYAKQWIFPRPLRKRKNLESPPNLRLWEIGSAAAPLRASSGQDTTQTILDIGVPDGI
jgi:hypothetical protein